MDTSATPSSATPTTPPAGDVVDGQLVDTRPVDTQPVGTTDAPEYLHTLIDTEDPAMAPGDPTMLFSLDAPVSRRSSTPLVVLAAAATLLLVVAIVFTLVRRGSADGPAAAPTVTEVVAEPEAAVPAQPAAVAASEAEVPVVPVVPAPAGEPAPVSPLPPLPLPDDVDGGDDDQPGVAVPPVAPEPVGPETTEPAPPEPPAPAPVLAAQASHVLDPGVEALTVTLQNVGDATLHYEIVNDGDGFTSDQPSGEIGAGGFADVWVDLEVAPEGEGPTLFQRVLEVESDGGSTLITVDGQVEKPGHLIAEYHDLPMVDYRATVEFTNVGGLPLEITGIDAPDLTVGLIPDQIAAGETIEVDVAICEGATGLPVFVPHVNPALPLLPQYQIVSWVTLETDQNTESTTVSSWTLGFDPPSCQSVVEPVTDDIVLGP